jgi:hypothetical protein
MSRTCNSQGRDEKYTQKFSRKIGQEEATWEMKA